MDKIVSISDHKSLGLISAFELSDWFYNELDDRMRSYFISQYAENKNNRYSFGVSARASIYDNLSDNDNIEYDIDIECEENSIEEVMHELFQAEYLIDDGRIDDSDASVNDSVEFLYSALAEGFKESSSEIDNLVINKMYDLFYKDRIVFYELSDFWSHFDEDGRRKLFLSFVYNFEYHKYEKNMKSSFLCSLIDKRSENWFNSEENERVFKEINSIEPLISESSIIYNMYIDCADSVYKMRNVNDFYLKKAIEFYLKSIENSKNLKIYFEKNAYDMVEENNKLPVEYRDEEWAQMTYHQNDVDMPSHFGFIRLAIIYEKIGNFHKALEFASKAKIEGWSDSTDNWDKRILKLNKKLS